MVDLVDTRDKVVGRATIWRCLRESLLHRAVAVLVIRSSGKYVIQRRSVRDRWHPGLWTLSSTGHVKRGERYEAAARRELKEELGIDDVLDPVRKYLLPPFRDRGLTEHEWVSLFTCHTDLPCTIDPGELEGVKEVTDEDLREMLDGQELTPDAKIILHQYFRP